MQHTLRRLITEIKSFKYAFEDGNSILLKVIKGLMQNNMQVLDKMSLRKNKLFF